MKTIKLGQTDINVPILAMGAASLGSIYHPVSQEEANATVELALTEGVNYFDVAPYYGLTKAETALGEALKSAQRNSYSIATKIGRYGDSDWDFSADATKRSIEQSLKRLNTDYIDVIQCHDIEYGNREQLINEALPTLRQLKEQGIVRYIGITGYLLDVLESVAIEQNVDTVMAYCTYTLQDRRLASVAKKLSQHGIGVINASPLGMGLLTERGAPNWHPANQQIQQVCQKVAEKCREYGETIENTALRFALSTAAANGIATTVIGTANAQNMQNNINCCNQQVDSDLLHEIDQLLEPILNVGWDTLQGNGGKAGK